MPTVGQMTDKAWEHLKTIGSLHNQVSFGIEDQETLNRYVITNETELAHPILLETLLENIELHDEFYLANKPYMEAVHRIVEKAGKDMDSIRSMIRLEAFLTMMKKYNLLKQYENLVDHIEGCLNVGEQANISWEDLEILKKVQEELKKEYK